MPYPYGDEWAGVPGYRRHPWRNGTTAEIASAQVFGADASDLGNV